MQTSISLGVIAVLVFLWCASASTDESATSKHVEPLGFKEHPFRVGDGKGGWICRSGEFQFIHSPDADYFMPFGVAQMDSGEVILLGSAETAARGSTSRSTLAVTAFSKDGGATWTTPTPIPGANSRPMMLTYLRKGDLTFQIGQTRFCSHDYGRTWTDQVTLPAAAGQEWNVEGNALVDRDAAGTATRIAEIGYKTYSASVWPKAFDGFIRWSSDGGRTWGNEVEPSAWQIEMEWRGQREVRGVSEGSITRARNGWLVAALRVDMPPRFYLNGAQSGADFDDSLEGLAISISRDDGNTWSAMRMLYEAGRHHAHIMTLPNGDIVMTYITRVDVRDGHLASYRRGCEALISHDSGKTWDIKRSYILDEFEFFDGAKWFNGETGHLCSTALKDGRILTVYGKYIAKGACIVRWRP